MEEKILTKKEWAKFDRILELIDERGQEKAKQTAEDDQRNRDQTVEQYDKGIHDQLISLVDECQERQVSEMKKNPNPLTNLELAEEFLLLPVVKRLRLTKRQLEKLISHTRENLSVGLYNVYEQGLGGLELSYQLEFETGWSGNVEDLRELFDAIFQKI
jgi:hypothetical protein